MVRIRKRKTVYYLLSLLLCVSILCIMAASAHPVSAAADSNHTIRVGYFAFDGYHNQDADGNRSGYGYEYLQQMARYTGWTYEYVGYDKSWSDAQKMLEDGEIDILTSAQKTPEREAIFDFSDDPIGYSNTIFTIKAGNEKYTIDNFDTFEGIRVGMIEGNSRNQQFDEFAREKGFTYEPVLFTDASELVEALRKEQIDAIVTSSLRVTDGEWIVSEFGYSPYYVCVKKGNQELLNQVNEAIGKINQENPSLQNELEDKYYGVDSGEAVAFTESERSYISDYIESGRKLQVLINPDRTPLSYYEDGQMAGLFGEVAEKILENTGLPYEVIEAKDRSEYQKLRNNHDVDLCVDMRFDYSQAEAEGYRLTDSYYSASISRVSKADFSGTIGSIAAIQNSDIASKLHKEIYKNAVITYYSTGAECVEAVKQGRQDAAFLYTYVAEEALRADITHKLSATLVPDFNTDFCIGISDTTDAILFTILNKSVGSIDRNWLDHRTIFYTETSAEDITFLEMIYNHPLAAISIIVVLLLLIGMVVFLFYRQQNQKKDEERAKEIKRLFGYVCGANEIVMEINLETMIGKEYYFKKDVLCIEENPYRTEENYNEFMNKEDYADVSGKITQEQLMELIEQGKEYVFEARGRGKDGIYRWYIYTLHGMVPDKIHPCNFMLFKRNIDDLKVKEEESRKALLDALSVAKEASEAKGNFMSRMSHEIRTPLNAVIGYLTLASDCLKDSIKVGDYVAKCQSAAKHLLNIINDVLDISAIESGKIKIASEQFDLKELLSTISLMFYNQAKEKGVNFQVEVRDLTAEIVIGDSLRLNQILMNLLSNAMKFTPKDGNIKLIVSQLQEADEQIRFRFEVSDTGIGMSKEFMSRIFSPFEQEKAETARKYGGSGLGLSITNNLITMMRGSISVESEEGKGTTFTVHLLFRKADSAMNKEKQQLDFRKVRALIVDDESRSCDYMKSLLKRCKVKCDVILSGEAAIRQIMKREGTDYEYDLCLIDWNMPGIDGIETARRIRQECNKNMPIIIASAYDTNEIRDAALAAGVNKVIAKPLFQSSMFDLLVDTFGKYNPQAAIEEGQQPVDFHGVRVLLAEDNDMNREIAVSILEKSGLAVDVAVDGKEAYDKFVQSKKHTYQVILMDVQMPVMDGYEATKAIRSSNHEQAKEIPILAMTANAFAEDVTAALDCGMNDHVAKPINYDKLYQLLVKYLKIN
ncbi:MAG: response regulator [Lachnospiraceae bacterium]|nr:response regulator [Lachnospiraceae bacterium]MDD3615837.1 response regulator [Lachnospiraceae bacterium]